MPGKSTPFTPSSILFRPREWWSRRVLPPGPKGLLRRPFIAIAGLRRHPEYRWKRLPKKERGGRTAAALRPPKPRHSAASPQRARQVGLAGNDCRLAQAVAHVELLDGDEYDDRNRRGKNHRDGAKRK